VRCRRLLVAATTALLFSSWLVSCRHAAPSGSAAVRPAARGVERAAWLGDVAHYRYDVPAGPGPADIVRVHRLVRESRAGRPDASRAAVFLLPGAPNSFEGIFLAPGISGATPRDHSIAAYLAARGVDVWGLDFGWALVPAATADFAAFRDWGMERDSRDASTGLAFARATRRTDGQGDRPLVLLGFSYGGLVALDLVGRETQFEPARRDAGGLILLDLGPVLEPRSAREYYCRLAADERARLDAGTLSDDTGMMLAAVGDAALTAPDAPSQHLEGFTNRQAALVFGGNLGLVTGQFWSFLGAERDAGGVPTRLRFTDERLWLDVLRAIPPHAPMRAAVDSDSTLCGAEAAFDDHLAEIALPIAYVGAAGGFGDAAAAWTRLTASADVTRVVVRQLPDEQRHEDFGHADTLLARSAPELVWRPVLDWLLAHP
jgi:hypothetical protein